MSSRGILAVLGLTSCLACGASSAAPDGPTARNQDVIAQIDLSKPFSAPRGATFSAMQGQPVRHPYFEDQTAPGQIDLCVRTGVSASCAPDLNASLEIDGNSDMFKKIHYLEASEIVYPRGRTDPPLLHLQVASLHAFNGSQVHAAIILAYRPSERRFEPIFQQQFGGNNNQEARYLTSGPLKGAMVIVHPTSDAPFGYWVTVHRLMPGYRYKQVLRFRSATHYGDGNPLAVVDSEMPNILRRLSLWRRGQPLPLPAGRCPRPHLVKGALWCS